MRSNNNFTNLIVPLLRPISFYVYRSTTIEFLGRIEPKLDGWSRYCRTIKPKFFNQINWQREQIMYSISIRPKIEDRGKYILHKYFKYLCINKVNVSSMLASIMFLAC